jgi:transcription elongation factor GreA
MSVQKQPPITLEGRERLRSDLDRLHEQREQISARLREEMQHRDEDFNQYVSTQELAQLLGRITHIESLLDAATESPPVPRGNDGIVAVGSTVTITDENGREQRYTIVTPAETDPSRGFISFTSPVGSALLGREPGEDVTITVPRGERRFRIVRLH